MMKRSYLFPFLVICLVLFYSTTLEAQFSLYLEERIPIPSESVEIMAISRDGRFLALGDNRGRISIRDIEAKRVLHDLKAHNGSVGSIVFDAKQSSLISGGSDGKVIFWDLYSGKAVLTLKEFRNSVSSVSLSPDDRLLAVAGERRDILIFEYPVGTVKGTMKGHKKNIVRVAFNPAGNQLLSVGEDKQMIVWDVNKLSIARKISIEARTMRGSGLDVRTAEVSYDGFFVGIGLREHILAKGGRGMIFKHNLSFYEWKTGAEIETLEGNKKEIHFFAVSPDKNYVVTDNSTLQNPELAVWNIQKGIIEQRFPVEGEITAVTLSENGNWMAVAYRPDPRMMECAVNVYRISGMEGYERFASGGNIQSTQPSGFGAAMKLTTPEEPLIGFGERRRMAVLTFDSPGLEADISRTTAYLLEGKLGNSPFVELVERNQIESVLSELRYQQTGLTTSDAVEVGKHVNAEFILIGSINKLGSLLIISAKLVNVETSQIEGTREVQCSNATIENISDMVALLAPTIARY